MSFTDNFTGSDGQEITARSGWTSIDYVAGTMLVKTNTLGQSGGSSGSVHCTDQGSTTCDTSADFDGIVGTNNTNIALCGVITDKNNLIGLRVPGGGATGTQFFKKISGTITTLVSFQGVNGHTYKISRNGDTYQIYDNGTQKGTDQTVTGFSGTTLQGMAIVQAGSSYNSAGWDNFTAAATGGGGTSYTITPSGGMQYAGSASYNRGRVFSPAGGMTFAGTGIINKTKVLAMTGGLVLGGIAAYLRGKIFTSSGGLQFSGTAPLSRNWLTVSGGLAFAGAAIVQFTSIAAPAIRELLRLSDRVFGRRSLKQRKF